MFVRIFFWRRDPAGHGKLFCAKLQKSKRRDASSFRESVAFRAVASIGLAGFDLDLDSY
jgi:hypothetical protein